MPKTIPSYDEDGNLMSSGHKEVIQQQALTHYQDMEKLREEVAQLFPFAEVRLVKHLDDSPFNFVSVHLGRSCIMTVDRDELEDIKTFMDAYAYSVTANNATTQKGNTDNV